MNTLTETIDSQIPALVGLYLAADSVLPLLATIADHDYEELAQPVRAPYIAVVPGPVVDKRLLTNKAEAQYPIDVMIFLPRQTPAIRSVTTPAAPTCAQGPAGTLSGTFRYGVTFYTASGEGYSSNLSSPITVSSHKVTLTIPTGPAGTVGRRIWRTEDGRLCARFLDLVADNTTTTYIDDASDLALGDEIAPDRYLGRKLAARIKTTLLANQTLRNIDTGTNLQMTGAILVFSDGADRIDPTRNQRIKTVRATYSIFYDMGDRQSREETP